MLLKTKHCFRYQVGDTEDSFGGVGSDMSVNYPSQWEYNMAIGNHGARIKMGGQFGQQTCADFTEPGQRKLFSLKLANWIIDLLTK